LPLSSRQLESAKPVAILLSRLAAVGKTTIVKAILRILAAKHLALLLCALWAFDGPDGGT
jgi:adenylylsulfate kinase-like enzyme